MRVVPNLATRLSVIAALTVGLAACGGGGGSSDLGGVPTTIVLPSTTTGEAVGPPGPAAPPTLLPDYASLVARARNANLAMYREPNAPTELQLVDNPDTVPEIATKKFPQIFPVLSQIPDGWVKIMLPTLPAGSSAWVQADDVNISQTAYRMRVDLGAGRLTVFGRGREIYYGPIVVDALPAALPAGAYYLRALFTAPESRTTASPFAYGLITKLSTLIPLGTPVDIVR